MKPSSQTLLDSTIIFCDGACSGNPGPGGWGAIVTTPDAQIRELGGGARQTTNNQMELLATTEALRNIAHVAGPVILYTDSVYVIRGITQWIWGWMRKGWKTAEGAEVSNREYWQALAAVVAKRKGAENIIWKYVRGHTGVPGNERCDEIAVAYSKGNFVRLYSGPLLGYPVPVLDLPEDEPLPEMRNHKTNGEKAKPYSYLSLVHGQVQRHATWVECERRVKGQPGAKFKKAMSADDEATILKSWGVKLSDRG